MKTPDLPAEDTSPGTRLVRAYLRHEEWSVNTFGPDKGPVGPLKHLVKEAEEAIEDPQDLSEYVDCQMLIWDAMRRAGFTLVEFIAAIEEKQKLLNVRKYERTPEGEPSFHVKEDAPAMDVIEACERTKRRWRDEPRPAFTRNPWDQA